MSRIHRVTDLRTGLPHPVRSSQGRFMSRRKAARTVKFFDDSYTREDLSWRQGFRAGSHLVQDPGARKRMVDVRADEYAQFDHRSR